MGPTIICDKSSLQALSKDELSVLRKYYSLNIPPILQIEILGDLIKHSNAEDSRREVEMLANKVLPACSTVNAEFRYLIRGELAGHHVEMTGVPVLSGARQISNADGKPGFIFEESAEHKALLRWQVGDFDGAEVLLAEAWRLSSQYIDLESLQRRLRDAYSGNVNLRTLAETGSFVDELLRTVPAKQLLSWFLQDAGVALRGNEAERITALGDARLGSLSPMLPYTAYCLRVALIFHFGLAFGLVSTRATNRLDLEYFYYAPFCHVFSSTDKFHRKMATVIVQNQMFVSGDVLKADLANLAKLKQEMEAKGVNQDAQHYGPPPTESSPTYQAWIKTMKPGFADVARDAKKHLTPEKSAELLKHFQQLIKEKPRSEPPSASMEDCEFMIMEHTVRANGPCICGSTKLFKDCCGRKIVEWKKRNDG